MSLNDQLAQLVRDAVSPMLTEALEDLEARLFERLAEVVQAQPAPPDPAPELLTLDEVADLLRVAPRTVQRMASAGEIPAPIQISPARSRWRRGDLDAWLDSQGRP